MERSGGQESAGSQERASSQVNQRANLWRHSIHLEGARLFMVRLETRNALTAAQAGSKVIFSKSFSAASRDFRPARAGSKYSRGRASS
jgi:hypothetical protein